MLCGAKKATDMRHLIRRLYHMNIMGNHVSYALVYQINGGTHANSGSLPNRTILYEIPADVKENIRLLTRLGHNGVQSGS